MVHTSKARSLGMIASAVVLARIAHAAQSPVALPSPPAQRPALAATPSLSVTPPPGTVVRRGEEVGFLLTVQGGANVPHDFVLTRVPDLVVGRVARGTGTVTIPFRVPADATPGRIDFRATATSTAPPRQLVASTSLIVGSVAAGERSPSPSPAAGGRSRWRGTMSGEIRIQYCQPTRHSGTIVLDVAQDGAVTGQVDHVTAPYSCTPPGAPYSVNPPPARKALTGRKTATAFNLRFSDGEELNLSIKDREATGRYDRDYGGAASSALTFVLRCVEGCR